MSFKNPSGEINFGSVSVLVAPKLLIHLYIVLLDNCLKEKCAPRSTQSSSFFDNYESENQKWLPLTMLPS